MKNYLDEFKKLNQEEEQITNKINEAYMNNTDSKEFEDELQKFYTRENEVAFNFIKDVNSGKVSDEKISIAYIDNGEDISNRYFFI